MRGNYELVLPFISSILLSIFAAFATSWGVSLIGVAALEASALVEAEVEELEPMPPTPELVDVAGRILGYCKSTKNVKSYRTLISKLQFFLEIPSQSQFVRIHKYETSYHSIKLLTKNTTNPLFRFYAVTMQRRPQHPIIILFPYKIGIK